MARQVSIYVCKVLRNAERDKSGHRAESKHAESDLKCRRHELLFAIVEANDPLDFVGLKADCRWPPDSVGTIATS